MKERNGLIWGLRIFSKALARVWVVPELRTWFFKTLALTIALAFLIIFGLFSLGSWAFASYFENAWSTAAALLVWTLTLFYIGGQLSVLLVSILVLIVGGESALSRYYFLEKGSNISASRKEQVRQMFKDRSLEIFSLLRTLAITCVFWPLFLFPLTMPFGVLVFAWAMAGDALIVAKRICHEGGYPAYQDSRKISATTQMGMALLPSSMALMPVLGWILLPVLQVAGLEAQLEAAQLDNKIS